MNLPRPRKHFRTSTCFVFLLTTTLLFLQTALTQDVGNNDANDANDANKYYTGKYTIFPKPTTETNSEDTITEKNVLETLFPPPSPDSLSSIPTLPTPDMSQSNGECVCLKFWLCSNNTIITDGTGLLDIRINKNNTCGSYQEKCCYHPDNTTPDNTTPDNTTPDNTTPGNNIIPLKKVVRLPCGTWNYKGVGFRITGNNDNEAEPGEFPWMILIFNLHPIDKTRTEILCGGSLIHPKVVLTAAHCLSSNLKPEDLTVRAGEWDIKVDQERNPHQDRKALRMVKHEKYSKGLGLYDVGLIFVDEPFELQPHIGTICLPPPGFKFDGDNCKASGWGSSGNNDYDGAYQAILKKIDLPIIRHDVCENKLKQSYLGINYKLHESFICTDGTNGKDTCKGDGGGPLVCPVAKNKSQFYIAGIVSWGIGCGDKYPGVYADVSLVRNWINQQMTELDQSYYDVDYVV